MNPESLAAEFRRLLIETIGDEAFQQVLEANRKNPGACASHEYCDANDVMNEAFRNLSGGDDINPQNHEHRSYDLPRSLQHPWLLQATVFQFAP